MRLTLKFMRKSTRLPRVLGICVDDIPDLAEAINAAEVRLIYAVESGDQGWKGSWARMVFNVLRSNPYVTLGRYGARLMEAAVCKMPIGIQNEFYEFLEFGNGLLPKVSCNGNSDGCGGLRESYVRGDYPTFRDMTPGHLIRVRALDALDISGTKRVLIQGTDGFDNIIYSQDGSQRVVGQYLSVVDPFVDTPFTLNTLSGIQKDITNGQIQFYDVDPATGNEVLILTMEPSEQVSGYRRYYFHGLPVNCCPVVLDAAGNQTVQIEALVKLNYIPVAVDSDYLLIQNPEAIIAECQSARYSTMDIAEAKTMAAAAHKDAIRLLNGELNHHYGMDKPALGFFPFGSARLERQAIGTLM